MKKLALLVLAMACLTPLYAKKTKLEMNLAKGDSFGSVATMEMDMTQQIMGMEVKLTSAAVFEMTSAVKDVTDEGFLVSITYDRAQMDMNVLGMSISASSDDAGGQDRMGTCLRAFVGKSFDVVMNKRGAIVRYVNLDQMVGEVVDEVKASLSKGAGEAMDSSFLTYFNEESLSRNIGFGKGFEFPAEAVKKGYKWSSTDTYTDNMMSMAMDSEYEFAGTKGGYWVVLVRSALTTPDDGATMSIAGNTVAVELSGTTLAEIMIDPKTGWVAESNATQDINGNVGISQMQMPMNIKTTISVRAK